MFKGYILNVRDANLACASCPAYTPADPALAEEVRRYVEAQLQSGRRRASAQARPPARAREALRAAS